MWKINKGVAHRGRGKRGVSKAAPKEGTGGGEQEAAVGGVGDWGAARGQGSCSLHVRRGKWSVLRALVASPFSFMLLSLAAAWTVLSLSHPSDSPLTACGVSKRCDGC